MSKMIGLTGPTGSGKSSATKIATERGIKVIDCDKLARVAVQKGTEGLRALTLAFGEGILLIDGSLDRKALAKAAFKDRESTELLNRTILPFIVELIKSQADDNDIMLDAPTLFESGIHSICQKTIAVLADKQIRLERIIKRDNLTLKEAELRMGAGKDDSFYKQNADYIIYNNNDEKAFLSSFDELLSNIYGGF